jgi:hypothetical protein
MPMEPHILVGGGLALAVLAGIAGLLLGRFVWPSRRDQIDPAAFAVAQADAVRREQECQSLRARADQLNTAEQARMSGEEVARLSERLASLTRQVNEQSGLLQKVESEKTTASSEAISLEISNFSSSSCFHCGPSSLGQTISAFDNLERTISSLMTKPALMVLPRPTSSASSVTGKRRQNVMRLLTWCRYGLSRSRHWGVDLKSSELSMTMGSVRSHSRPAR